jgi:exodeoxyribonuclease VII large subunit
MLRPEAKIMPETAPSHNQLAYSVSEISTAIKRLVEDNFGHVRVRGEISGWKLATSGHAYLKLKDENALLDAVCWKGVVSKIPFRPEDGMEVVCSGRLTTYPGRSNYQLVIDYMEPAGVGALMALLEKRKAMLAAEGLFDAKRKKTLPFMPRVIGVVTSPTGAVIRDILHRLSDRFPCNVIVWGVPVQGEGAAEKIAAAINGFNGSQLQVPPDLIIVARGGGSLEDLWAFNEEVVVRAVAASRIPVISAVGHETDTTLIDYVADRRAPTPTAAAEIAVPVREELLAGVMELEKRLLIAMTRFLQVYADKVSGLARGLPNPGRLIDVATQRLDDWSERLYASLPSSIQKKSQFLAVATAKLQPHTLLNTIERDGVKIHEASERMKRIVVRNIEDRERKLANAFQLLETLAPKNVLKRGFALVRNAEGGIVMRSSSVKPQELLELEFFDGKKSVIYTADKENPH